MAQYDGSIRINTKIDSKEASVQLMTLENRIAKTADRIAGLRSKMDALKDTKIPTQQYTAAQKEVNKYTDSLQKAKEKIDKLLEVGVDQKSSRFVSAQYDVAQLENKLLDAEAVVKRIEQEGKAFTLGSGTEEYAKLRKQLQYAESELSVMSRQHDVQEMKLKRLGSGYKDLAGKAKSAFNSVGNVLKKANSTVNAFGRRLRETAQKHLPFFRKEAERVKSSLSGFSGRIKSLALSLLIFNQISAGFRAASSAISAGFKNLYDDNERFKVSIDGLKASVLTLQNAFAAAFRPIVDMAVPYIQKLVEGLTEVVNLAGQFIAALTGRKTYTRAIKQTAKASEEAADAAEEETEAINKQLSPLDDLNNLTSESNKEKNKGKDDKETGTGIMFEEVPIDSGILEMADKVKNILSKLFAPLKEAWNREGKFVMDSWKYALDEVRKLIKDIGRDFLTVWQQEKTIKIFEDLLHIIGDIGLIVGHLARNFRDAWNENKTGLHILENIRDIIGVIIHNIREAADKTVEWADKLDFGPLLEAFERFTESLIPVADALSGILTDFYTQVLLPLGKWTLEKGLPELLDVFTAFNEKVDWDALRTRLSEFWEHLEPFAETVGEGLIIFIERISDALADFINSPEFDSFLTKIEEWMDSVTPEDVADALTGIAEALIALKLALLGFGAISAVTGAFATIKSFLGFIAGFGGLVSRAAGLVASGVSGIVAALGGILPALSLVAAAVIGWKIGEWINENLLGVDTPSFFEMMDGIKSSFTDGSWKEALHLWGEDIKAAWTEIWGYVKDDFNNSILGQVLGSFTDGSWREALSLWGDDIYNAFVTLGERQEEWLNSLKEKWSRTWADIKGKIDGKISSIRSTVGSAIDWIKGKLEALKDSLNPRSGVAGSILFGGGSRASGGGASRISASLYAANPAYASLASMDIPAYATGQVIPRSMKQHLAILGDNTRETEVVSPISTIKQALREEARALGLVGGGNGQAINLNLTVECEGYQLLHILQKLDAEFVKQNGRHALA